MLTSLDVRRMIAGFASIFIFAAGSGTAQEQSRAGFIPAFPIKHNDIELSRLAQPNQYFDKIGPKAGIMGSESGNFEMWVWPWKVLRNFELQFLLGTSTAPILARDIAHTIHVTPELTTITYSHEAFTVKQHFVVPRHEPGAIMLLEVTSTTPLSVVAGFIPVMQPMWPCGIGGQFSYWDDGTNAYVISEGQWRGAFLCGSPAGKQMAAPPAHMFADAPLQFRIDIAPGENNGRFIPIVIAGAMPDTLSWKMNFDSVKAAYSRLWKRAEFYYTQCHEYFRQLRHSTLRITTPDERMNLAFEWGKVALDNLFIENPRLGHGMVAGFGLSGGGARPGFAWYFGGDAFINVLALNSVGMFRQSREALSFTQKWQRQDHFPIRKKNPADPPKDVGKMAHELSQSDGLCDWWNDYRYGYNHADTSPWYLVAMGDYVRTSGDTAFLRESWASVKLAYAWCLSKDSDGDGLMDLKGAGLGALEFGKLVGIYADVYTCGVFLQGVKEMEYMAALMRDSSQLRQAAAQFRKAQPRMEKLFWLEKEGYYAYGATEKGEQVKEKTPWSGVAMMFGLLDKERSARTLEALNSADVCTDWGVRTLSNTSALFEPTNYNYGAVWPFIASFFNTAQFKHHFALAGSQVLEANVGHVFDYGLGVVPEVFSGSLNTKLAEGYHHQGFSTTGYMLPLVRGLLGLEVDGLRSRLSVSPHVPGEWESIELDGIHVRDIESGFVVERDSIRDNIVLLNPMSNRLLAYSVSLPLLPGSELNSDSAFLGAQGSNTYLNTSGSDDHATTNLAVFRAGRYEIYRTNGVSFSSRDIRTRPGQTQRGLRFVSERSTGKTVRLVLEGLSGNSYLLGLDPISRVKSVENATFNGVGVTVTFPIRKELYSRKEIVLILQ